MDASFYFLNADDSSQELGDQIVPSAKVTLNGQHNAANFGANPATNVSV